jgi:hypothetical protein
MTTSKCPSIGRILDEFLPLLEAGGDEASPLIA